MNSRRSRSTRAPTPVAPGCGPSPTRNARRPPWIDSTSIRVLLVGSFGFVALFLGAPITGQEALLQVAGASDQGMSVTVTRPSLDFVFEVDSMSTKSINGVRILVSPLTTPDGGQVPVKTTVRGKKARALTISPLGSLRVRIVGELPLAGAYSGRISLIYQKTRSTIPLTIQRVRVPPSVEILAVDTVRSMIVRPWTGSDSTICLTLHETAGTGVTLTLPMLATLALEDGEASVQAEYESVDVVVVNDADQESACVADGVGSEIDNEATLSEDEGESDDDPDSGTAEAGEGEQGASPAGDISDVDPADIAFEGKSTIELASDATLNLKMTVRKLRGAGRFAGTIIVSSEGAPSMRHSIELLRRDAWWWAAVAILAGVALSAFIRHRFGEGRARAIEQRELLLLSQDIKTLSEGIQNPTPEERSVLASYDADIERTAAELALGVIDSGADARERIRRNLVAADLWVRTRLTTVRVVDQAARDGYLQDLADLAPALRAASTQEEYEALVSQIEEIQAQVLATIQGQAVPPGVALVAQALPASVDQGRRQIAAIERRLGRDRWLRRIVVVGIAVATGLQLLWIENQTWGGVESYLAALLWGLGLHQVGNAAFDLRTFERSLLGDSS